MLARLQASTVRRLEGNGGPVQGPESSTPKNSGQCSWEHPCGGRRDGAQILTCVAGLLGVARWPMADDKAIFSGSGYKGVNFRKDAEQSLLFKT